MRRAVDLRTHVGSVPLPNPVLTASGTAGHGAELGGLPRPGHARGRGGEVARGARGPATRRRACTRHRRACSTRSASRGPGSGPGSRTSSPRSTSGARGWWRASGVGSAEDYAQAAAMLAGAPGVVAVEVNVSCPNLEDRSRMFAHSAHATAAGRGRVGRVRSAPVGEAEPQRPRPRRDRRPPPSRPGPRRSCSSTRCSAWPSTCVVGPTDSVQDPGGGGLSGPAIRPVAVRAVHDCRAAFPTAGIVGVGGVTRGVDVVEMMLAGADAVEVGTATFRDPRAPARVLAGLRRWCRLHDVGDVRRLVGAVHGVPPVPGPATPAPPPAPAPVAAPTPRPATATTPPAGAPTGPPRLPSHRRVRDHPERASTRDETGRAVAAPPDAPRPPGGPGPRGTDHG